MKRSRFDRDFVSNSRRVWQVRVRESERCSARILPYGGVEFIPPRVCNKRKVSAYAPPPEERLVLQQRRTAFEAIVHESNALTNTLRGSA